MKYPGTYCHTGLGQWEIFRNILRVALYSEIKPTVRLLHVCYVHLPFTTPRLA